MAYNRNSNKMQHLGFTQGEDWDPCENCTYFKIFINLFLLHVLNLCVKLLTRDPVVMQYYFHAISTPEYYECCFDPASLRCARSQGQNQFGINI